MRDILSGAGLDSLRDFAWRSCAVAFDYDGTLAPLTADRDAAAMRPRTAELLRRVASVYPTLVISGRDQADLDARVDQLGLAEVIGHCGLEPLRRLDQFATQVKLWKAALLPALSRIAGAELEDKTFTLAIHYRAAAVAAVAEQRILDALAGIEGARVLRGKRVVNVVPEGGPHKGLALYAARQRLGCEAAIYVGDDASDEEVFALDAFGPVLGIRVGQGARSRAGFFIAGQERVDALLSALAHLRGATSHASAKA